MLTAIERRQRFSGKPQYGGVLTNVTPTATEWTFGAPEVDGWLPYRHLDTAGVHEIKPQTYSDTAAALSFALFTIVRRLSACSPDTGSTGSVVWCWPTRASRDAGGLYGPGLATLGLDPTRLLLVETATATETLWAMEESLASGVAAIVVGCLDEITLTPARRLALAAQTHRTPALLVTAARSHASPATTSRWRIAARLSAPHAFDPMAPGEPRFAVTLDRCRGSIADVAPPSCILEWNHDAHRFGMVAGMADRTFEKVSRA